MKRFITFFFFIVIYNSCSNRDSNIKLNNIIGKELLLPTNLIEYQNNLSNNPDYNIYTVIDVSCGSCLAALEDWYNQINSYSEETIQLNIICISEDDFALFEYLFEAKHFNSFPFRYFFDYEGDYIKENSFMLKGMDYQTLLVDKNNIIKLIGNPLYNNELSKLYNRIVTETDRK